MAAAFKSLKYKNFRCFLFGHCISLIGTWMQRTAQVWLVYKLTKSAFFLGLLGVFQFAPILILSLFAGVIIDRFSKRNTLILIQIGFIIQALILYYLVWSGHANYWNILILSGLFGLIQTFEMPARQSFFIDLVDIKDLMNAISLNSTAVNLAKVIGPICAGIIITQINLRFCFLINIISFLPIILSLFLIKIQSNKCAIKSKTNIINDTKKGIQYIYHNRELKSTVIIMAIVCTFAMNADVIIPVFTKEILHRGAREYGILLGSMGLGSVCGALTMAKRSKNGLNKFILIYTAFGLSIIQIITAFFKTYAACIIIFAIIGFLNLTFLNMANSTLQLNSVDEYRGRVMSVYSLLNLGTTPIGNFYAGSIMQIGGGGMGFLMCGIVTLILVIITNSNHVTNMSLVTPKNKL